MDALGIDIGGSGIKGAPVDTKTGRLLQERFRIPTPDPAKPKAVGEVVAEVAKHFKWKGPVGCGFPAVIQNGVAMTAANIHEKWIETNAAELFKELTGCPVIVLNDADAAGMAEMTFGAGKGRQGTVLMITIGTGIGTAIFTNGVLLPNTEFGHLTIRGMDAEHRASDAVRKQEDLTWKKWSKRLNEFLAEMERLIWPDLIIVSGGVSKYNDKFFPLLETRAEIVPAQFLNEAGIVGAALAAESLKR
jgi:polyphosphate glucokinase